MVERDEPVRRLYEEEMKEWGYEVIVLSGGHELLTFIAREKPQVVILGVRIPGYDSFKLLEEMKDSFPDLPVIFNTSLCELWPHALARGADFCSQRALI